MFIEPVIYSYYKVDRGLDHGWIRLVRIFPFHWAKCMLSLLYGFLLIIELFQELTRGDVNNSIEISAPV